MLLACIPDSAVAVLFLVELDNITYAIGLSETVRTRVETHGRVKLQLAEAKTLAFSKTVHTAVILLFFLLKLGEVNFTYTFTMELSPLPIFSMSNDFVMIRVS